MNSPATVCSRHGETQRKYHIIYLHPCYLSLYGLSLLKMYTSLSLLSLSLPLSLIHTETHIQKHTHTHSPPRAHESCRLTSSLTHPVTLIITWVLFLCCCMYRLYLLYHQMPQIWKSLLHNCHWEREKKNHYKHLQYSKFGKKKKENIIIIIIRGAERKKILSHDASHDL